MEIAFVLPAPLQNLKASSAIPSANGSKDVKTAFQDVLGLAIATDPAAAEPSGNSSKEVKLDAAPDGIMTALFALFQQTPVMPQSSAQSGVDPQAVTVNAASLPTVNSVDNQSLMNGLSVPIPQHIVPTPGQGQAAAGIAAKGAPPLEEQAPIPASTGFALRDTNITKTAVDMPAPDLAPLAANVTKPAGVTRAAILAEEQPPAIVLAKANERSPVSLQLVEQTEANSDQKAIPQELNIARQDVGSIRADHVKPVSQNDSSASQQAEDFNLFARTPAEQASKPAMAETNPSGSVTNFPFQSTLERTLAPHTPEIPANQPANKQPFPDKYDIAGQIVEHAKLIARPQNTEMVIKLKPEHLGELTFRITVEQGTVSAAFHSNNPEVRSLIETGLLQLKQELNSQGLKVDHVGVYAGMQQFLQSDQQGGQRYAQQIEIPHRRRGEKEFTEIIEEVQQPAGASNLSGVDYRV